jgi:hypothetical protein
MADIVKTRDQLIYRALKNLGQVEPGEAAAPEDYSAVDDLVDPLIAQLAFDNIYYISDPDEIENEIYLPLARLLANVAGPDFGSAMNEEAKQVDEALLKKMAATKPSYLVARGQFF